MQIGNSNGLVKARKTPATAKLEVELPFEATDWRTVWLDHFSFGATNYKASVSYYTNLLGWKGTYDEGSQNEVLMGDVGDAIIRGGNPNDPNFGKPPANGKAAAAERPHRSHLVWHPAVGFRRREGRSGEARAARPDRHRQHRRYPPGGLQELSHPDAQRIQPADELRHQGHAADRIELDEAGAVSAGNKINSTRRAETIEGAVRPHVNPSFAESGGRMDFVAHIVHLQHFPFRRGLYHCDLAFGTRQK